MCKALEDMVEDAKAEGKIEGKIAGEIAGKIEISKTLICSIHKKYCKQLTPADAADALELTVDEVVKVYQLIKLHPDFSDLQLAELVVQGSAN